MCDKMAISAHIVKIVEFSRLQIRAKETFSLYNFCTLHDPFCNRNHPLWVNQVCFVQYVVVFLSCMCHFIIKVPAIYLFFT